MRASRSSTAPATEASAMAAITNQDTKNPSGRRRFGGGRGRSGGPARSGSAGSEPATSGQTAPGPRMNWRIRLRRDKSLVLMTVPALVLLLLFNYLPMAGII